MIGRLIEHYRLAIREARFIRVSLLLAAALNLLAWILVLWFVLPRFTEAPVFALHYTVYFGVDRIGPSWRLASTPLLGTAIVLTGAALTAGSYRRSRHAAAMAAAVTLGLEALLFAASFLNVLLNF
jgi:hypothetical protein